MTAGRPAAPLAAAPGLSAGAMALPFLALLAGRQEASVLESERERERYIYIYIHIHIYIGSHLVIKLHNLNIMHILFCLIYKFVIVVTPQDCVGTLQ